MIFRYVLFLQGHQTGVCISIRHKRLSHQIYWRSVALGQPRTSWRCQRSCSRIPWWKMEKIMNLHIPRAWSGRKIAVENNGLFCSLTIISIYSIPAILLNVSKYGFLCYWIYYEFLVIQANRIYKLNNCYKDFNSYDFLLNGVSKK